MGAEAEGECLFHVNEYQLVAYFSKSRGMVGKELGVEGSRRAVEGSRPTYTLNNSRPHPRDMPFNTLTPRTRNNQRTPGLDRRQ